MVSAARSHVTETFDFRRNHLSHDKAPPQLANHRKFAFLHLKLAKLPSTWGNRSTERNKQYSDCLEREAELAFVSEVIGRFIEIKFLQY